MRIGYVIWSLGLGGAEQVVIRLAEACRARGHEPTIFTLNEPGPFANQAQAAGIDIVPMHKKGAIDWAAVRRLQRALTDRKIDVVHTHLWGANVWGRLAAHRARIPAVATEHNVDTWKSPVHFAIDRFLASRGGGLAAVSHQVREFYENRGVGLGRWRVIYNGVSVPPQPAGARGPAFRELGIGDADRVVGLVGRLVPAKAPGVFLEAVAAARSRVPNLKALIVGDGPLRGEAEAKADQLGLKGSVVLAGLRQDMPQLMAGMDVLAFSSEREGLSMAMLEAMAAGVPVVATAVGGTPELIDSGRTGLLVPPKDPAALADAIARVLTDAATARSIREQALRQVREKFSLQSMVDAYEQLYAEAIRSAPGLRAPAGVPRAGRAPSRICHVVDHLDIGGAQRQLVELVKRLPRGEWDPVVVCLSTEKTALADELRRAGVAVYCLRQHGALDLHCLRQLTALMKGIAPVLVHTWLFTADTYGRLAARRCGIRHMVAGLRNTLDDMPPHYRLVNQWLARGTSAITVNVDAIRKDVERHGGIAAGKLRTIYNGIDLAAWDAAAENGSAPRREIAPHGPVIAMIARFSAQKDHETFLAAAKIVAGRRGDATFALIGDGPRRAAVEKLVREHGLQPRVRLMGERRDVRRLLAEIDVCALASHFEGCSNAVMEAMAASRPVVATAVGGNPELIADGQTGLLVPTGDAEAMAAAILRLLDAPDLARQMGERARRRIEERFTIAVTLEQTQRLYRELISGNPEPAHVA